MPNPTAADDALALAQVLDELGRPGFGTALLAWLAPALPASHATAFRFDAAMGTRVVMTASVGGGAAALQSARVYLGRGMAGRDQLTRQVRQRAGEAPAAPTVLRLRRGEIQDTGHGEQLWDPLGLVERLTALAPLDGRWTALNLYRDQAQGHSTARELARFKARAPLLLALLRRHLLALQPTALPGAGSRIGPEQAALLLKNLPAKLSVRESEVCAHTLAGLTRDGIGLSLGIASSSVATLRQRAYQKLKIHGAGELFALCLRGAQAASMAP